MERATPATDFLSEMDRAIAARLERIAAPVEREDAPASGEVVPIAALLATALKKELEAAEEAALWLTTERDLEVKLALMRQCGDEAKHYRLIEARMRALGVTTFDPEAGGRTKMFAYFESLPSTVERIAAGPYAREALAGALNVAFIELCEARGDEETARLYREIIQPDELHHHGLGRSLLARFAVSDDDRDRARAAIEKTLAIAEELQEIARVRRGITCAPGC